MGNVGDYYIDKTSGALYGPKTANGWGAPIPLGGAGTQGPAGPSGDPLDPAERPQALPDLQVLSQVRQGGRRPRSKGCNRGNRRNRRHRCNGCNRRCKGAKGATGAAGLQIYSGQGAPPAATGTAGDYYIDDLHAIIYGPKTAAGWPATGVNLQVNNTITYDFVDKVAQTLPYNWDEVILTSGPGYTWINLPYNDAAAQTTGFTIPQSIADNGTVLCYIRYFGPGGPNDTATDAGLTQWFQVPYAPTYTINGVTTRYTVTVWQFSMISALFDLSISMGFPPTMAGANSTRHRFLSSKMWLPPSGSS